MLRAVSLDSHRELELAQELYSASTHCGDFAVYEAHYEMPPVERLIRIINDSDHLGIALKIEPSHGVVEILKDSEALSESTWKRSVNQANGIDWLLTPRVKKLFGRR